MKPKHAWNRKRNGTYSNLRHYRNLKKGLGRVCVRRDGSIYIIVNNRQKMAGKPMRRTRQIKIAKKRYLDYLVKQYFGGNVVSHDMKKSSSEKRAEREQVLHGQQCRYSRMERDGRREVAEKHFKHKPYGKME